MMRRLTEANLRTDPAMMTEVHQLLGGLADAWRAVAPEAAAAGVPGGEGGSAGSLASESA